MLGLLLQWGLASFPCSPSLILVGQVFSLQSKSSGIWNVVDKSGPSFCQRLHTKNGLDLLLAHGHGCVGLAKPYLIFYPLQLPFKKLHESMLKEWNQRIENPISDELSSVWNRVTLNSTNQSASIKNTIFIIIITTPSTYIYNKRSERNNTC